MKQHKWIGGENEVFHYCSELEDALRQYYGDRRWHSSAGLFRNHRHVRKAVLAASRAIRKRLQEVNGADDRFLLSMSIQLESLDRLAKRLGGKGENLIEMLGCLLEIVATLLGYDWRTGKPNRQLTYSQTWNQVHLDDWKMQPQASRRDPLSNMEREDRRMEELVATLFDEGFRVEQIARMLCVSLASVKDRLVRCGKLSRDKSIYAQGVQTRRHPDVGSDK